MNKKNLIAALVTTLGLFSHAASALVNPAIPDDLSGWTCTGYCGSMLPEGDVVGSPALSSRYGFVSTYSSTAVGVAPLTLGDGQGINTETNGSKYVSGAFSAAAGQNVRMQFNFVSTDGKKYEDWAWARVVNAADNKTAAWLFTAQSSTSAPKSVVPGKVTSEFDAPSVITNYDSRDFVHQTANWAPLGDSNGSCFDATNTCGHTGWLESSITLAAAGNYKIEIGVTNYGDAQYDSALAFDFQGMKHSTAALTSPSITAAVPEPESYAMMLAGLALIGGIARRRKSV